MNTVYSKYLCESSHYDQYKETRDIETANVEMKNMDRDLEFLKYRIEQKLEKANIEITEPYIEGECIKFALKNYNNEDNKKVKDILYDMRDISWGPISGDYSDMSQGYEVSLDLEDEY
ncbi:hypothetical protein [Campylobacter phage CP81]|uniref:Uncharacterized protein n=4 Tax=Fletchervirus TaxID=1636618 RepID=G8GIR5_9CAUD|nr:hypothetical protein CaPhCPX_gp003 [Campylobacter phage CPX]YP_009623400.1 hypothetical protein FDJ37_gp141 [Campylobacter phage CP81]AGS81174.1 hypothetical protein [Campylobacter phage CP8]QPX63108.1 hypothetical protein F336_150 [Campylobacter phage F336]AET34300.1 hypothetical protein [Campylobacter phage CPX]CBZ42341.1 hypothetical protein [Campylobacter phage CP81]